MVYSDGTVVREGNGGEEKGDTCDPRSDAGMSQIQC